MNKPFHLGSRNAHKKAPQHPDACNMTPVKRPSGEHVTLSNCAPKECRWPYELRHGDLVLCGRPMEKWPYCKWHRDACYAAGRGSAK